MNNSAQVMRVVGADVLLYANNEIINALCPKRIKLQGLCAGDFVEYVFNDSINNNCIINLHKRKNHIERPTISNVDNGFIVVSEVPQPDFYVIDKILVNLGIQEITPYIIVSKLDIITDDFINEIVTQYKNCVQDIIVLSALNKEGLERFAEVTKGKVSVLIGQSAVGKSSLLNALGIKNIKTDTLALKIGKKRARGKNTTKNSQLYLTDYGALIADTPGFKILDLDKLEPRELTHYYPDIRDYAVKCQYSDCTHLPDNKGCQVIKALNDGKICQDRYNRYITLKSIITKNERKKYDK